MSLVRSQVKTVVYSLLERVSRKGAAAGNNWVDERMTDWREEARQERERVQAHIPTHTHRDACWGQGSLFEEIEFDRT